MADPADLPKDEMQYSGGLSGARPAGIGLAIGALPFPTATLRARLRIHQRVRPLTSFTNRATVKLVLTLLGLLVQLASVGSGIYLMVTRTFLMGAALISVMIVIQGLFSNRMDAMLHAWLKSRPDAERNVLNLELQMGNNPPKPAAWMKIENGWKIVLIALQIGAIVLFLSL